MSDVTPQAILRAYVQRQPATHAFAFENGDTCVVLTAPSCGEFHEWHYYLLLNDDKLRVVRRHKILPDVYPTKIIDCTKKLDKADSAIVNAVAEKITSSTLVAMPDCSRG